MDEGFSKTVRQNSLKLGTKVMQRVIMMHADWFLKPDHLAPSGGRTKFSTKYRNL